MLRKAGTTISTTSEQMYKYCITNGRNINTADECYTSPEVYDTVLKKALNKFKYPENMIRNSDVLTAIHRGVELQLTTNNCLFEDRLDYHKEHKLSGVVGGCYLVDDNVYGEYKTAMEKVPPHTHHVVLSEREKVIIEKLNKRSGD